MKQWFVRIGSVAAILVMASTFAYAQGGATSSLSGTVVDTSEGAVPGATVVVKNKGTGITYESVTSSQGTFVVPALPPGTYSVTVTLSGFKTVVLNDVVVSSGIPGTVRAKLEVGGLTETVVVEGATSLIQTQASSVSSTINVKQIQSLPLTSKNVMDFVTFLPGVSTAGGNRQSTINGLPQAAVNITMDGVNIQDNTLKSSIYQNQDGFFTIVQPRLDAIEEVTVSTAAGEAAGGGQGAVQIRFTTRSGTNAYTGGLYHYFRKDTWKPKLFGQKIFGDFKFNLNMNPWFNIRNGNRKPRLLQDQTGGNFGGPVRIPGLYDGRNRAFFFVNGEQFKQPSEVSRTRTILHPNAQVGIFRYAVAGGVIREINLWTVATAAGQTSTVDPGIAKLLADIRTAAGTTGSIRALTNPLHDEFAYNVQAEALNYYPTVRLDYNFTSSQRFSTIFNYHTFSSKPDTLNGAEPFFPGFPVFGSQTSKRISLVNTLRSTIAGSIVNEARVGYSGAPVEFFNEQFDKAIWNAPVGNQQGFHLNLGATGISNAGTGPNAQSRNASTLLIENTVSWLKGNHNLSFGGSMTRVDVWLKNKITVPTVSFAVLNADPAFGMFNTTNFPGAATADLTAARNLYAVLTGRVSSIAGNARINAATGEYEYSGLGLQEGRLDDLGFFAQDSWRIRPNLSLNLGLRYDIQLPFRALNSSYATATLADVWGVSGYAAGCDPSDVTPSTCNIFKTTTPGVQGQYSNLTAGTQAYKMDKNNISPSVGFNWTPHARSGLLGKIMGPSGDFAVSGGFARSFVRNGMQEFTGTYGANPGLSLPVQRNESLNNLGTLPLLLRETSRLGAPTFVTKPVYPNSGVITNSINTFDPNIQVAYADSWTLGFQRGLTKNMAAEVRYVGTRSRNQWTVYNLNEINIIENGFLNEFKLAQANLQANIAANRGANFRYFGPGTGTVPLPIYLAYFSGIPQAQSGNAALYTSANFASATFTNPMARFNPNPFTAANSLDDDAGRRTFALQAGLPSNFLLANPDKLGGANVVGHGGFSDYNSMQFELRRRLANGVQFNASYVYGLGDNSQRYSFRVPRETIKSSGVNFGEVTHAFKINWMYELPFGRGKRWGSNAGGVLDRIIGGWQVFGNARVQSGLWVDFGNVRMVGFDRDDLKDFFKLRIDENRRVFMLPQEIIEQTINAFSVSATSATGYGSRGAPSGRYFAPANGPDCMETISNAYGDCGERTINVRGPMFREVDISIMKTVPIVKRVRAEFRIEMLNAFNTANFVPVGNTGTDPTNYELSTLRGTNTARVVQLVSRISW